MRTTISLSVILFVLTTWAVALPVPNPTRPEVRAIGGCFYSFFPIFLFRLKIPSILFFRVTQLSLLLAVPGMARNPQSSPPPPSEENCTSCHAF